MYAQGRLYLQCVWTAKEGLSWLLYVNLELDES